jgi:hypothetical protein
MYIQSIKAHFMIKIKFDIEVLTVVGLDTV